MTGRETCIHNSSTK